MKEFIAKVQTRRESFDVIKTSHSETNKIQATVLNALNLKGLNELRDKFEGVAFYNDFLRRIISVLAVEKLLKVELIDWATINPRTYKADMSKIGLDIDIITSEYGNFPVMEKESKRPAIIAIKKDEKSVWICGFASVTVLNNNQNNTEHRSTWQRQNKTAFIGFDKLIPLRSADELKELFN